jgi:glutathione synthase/RimK-type ligase-like ATP-grasp enzyme
MDLAKASGAQPLLCQYIARATHFRLVVVADQVVASYRNAQARDDFRSYASDELSDYLQTPSPDISALAVRAAEALEVATAGVDILAAPDGQLYVLEANFPCYFPQAQIVTGVDIAGKMLDYLLEKRRIMSSS